MNSFIIQNWHPFLVHFTIALVVTSSVFFVLTKLLPKRADTFAIVAKWTLWSAAFVTVLTLLAGFAAFNSVAHDDTAHIVMKTHRLWALFAAAALFIVAIWSYRTNGAPLVLVVGSVVVAGLVGTTGYLGAELVYRHGLGVMRLPDNSGEGHSHAGGSGHSHNDGAVSTGDHHTAVPPTKHEQRGADGHGHSNAASQHDHGEDCGDIKHANGEGSALAFAKSFQVALNGGDFDTVAGSFAADAVIFENGVREVSLEDYLEHHLKPEMPMLKAASRQVLKQEVVETNSIAIVSTASMLSIKSKGKQHDFYSAETLTLQTQKGEWKVIHVHWSSRPVVKRN